MKGYDRIAWGEGIGEQRIRIGGPIGPAWMRDRRFAPIAVAVLAVLLAITVWVSFGAGDAIRERRREDGEDRNHHERPSPLRDLEVSGIVTNPSETLPPSPPADPSVVARGSAPRCGRVRVQNRTDQTVTIVLDHWIDSEGLTRKGALTWDVVAGGAIRPTTNGWPIVARAFGYRLRTPRGETPAAKRIWIAQEPDGTDLDVRIESSMLPLRSIPVAPSKLTDAQQRAILSIVGALVADRLQESVLEDDDAGIGSFLLGAGILAARDGLIENAVNEAFPGESAVRKRAIARCAELVLDGTLSRENFERGAATDQFLEELGERDADLGKFAQGLAFLEELSAARARAVEARDR